MTCRSSRLFSVAGSRFDDPDAHAGQPLGHGRVRQFPAGGEVEHSGHREPGAQFLTPVARRLLDLRRGQGRGTLLPSRELLCDDQ